MIEFNDMLEIIDGLEEEYLHVEGGKVEIAIFKGNGHFYLGDKRRREAGVYWELEEITESTYNTLLYTIQAKGQK